MQVDVDKGSPPIIFFTLDDEVSWVPGTKAWDELPCDEKLQHAKRQTRVASGKAESRVVRIVQGVRPRWWYFGVSLCGAPGRNDTLAASGTLALHMTNPLLRTQQEEELSWERAHVPVISRFGMWFFVVLLLWNLTTWGRSFGGGAAGTYLSVQKPLIRLLCLAVAAFATSMACLANYWQELGLVGRASPAMGASGRFALQVGRAVVLCLLLAVSRGFGVVSIESAPPSPNPSRNKATRARAHGSSNFSLLF
jgi:hypothetical protein